MISPDQIRAARALLDWKLSDLAKLTGITVNGISLIERGEVQGRRDSLETIQKAFESRDVQFLPDDGVKRRVGAIDRLAGPDALNRLFDDVYDTVKEGGDLCVSGVNEQLFAKFNVSEEEALHHRTRMTKIKDKIKFRVLLKEGDYYFRNDSYIEYRWIPEEFFYEYPIYLYNDKLAFIKFENNNLEIVRMTMASMATAFRAQFEFIWSHSKTPPKRKEAK